MRTSVSQGTLYLTASSLLFAISGYVTRIWLGQHLGPAEYGVYGVVISLNTALSLVSNAGVPRSVAKHISEGTAKADAILRSGLFVQCGSTLIVTMLLVLSAEPLARLLKDPSLTPYLRVSALILTPYSILVLYWGYLNGLHFFKRVALTNAMYSVSKVVLVLGLGYLFGLYGAIVAFIIAPIISLLWAFHVPRVGIERFPYRSLLLFSLPLLALSIISTLQQSVDLWFVKALRADDADSGYYAASQDIARILFFGLNGLQPVLFPAISHSVRHDSLDRTRWLVRQSLRFTFMLLIPGSLLISANSHQVVALLYSDRYIPAGASLSVLAFGLAFVTLFGVLSSILSGAGRPTIAALIAAGGLLCTGLLCGVLIPVLGLRGAALATTLGGLLSAAIAAITIYRQFGCFISPISVTRITVAALSVYVVARVVILPGIFLLTFWVVLFGLYLAILKAIGEFQPGEMRSFRNMVSVAIPFLARRRTKRQP